MDVMTISQVIVVFKAGMEQKVLKAVEGMPVNVPCYIAVNHEAEGLVSQLLTEPDPNALIVTVGGDGTFVTGARIAKRLKAKLVGYHAGTLGFLAAWEPTDTAFITELVEYLRNHDNHVNLAISNRHMVSYWGKSGEEAEYPVSHALNEFTISGEFADQITTYELFIGAQNNRQIVPHQQLSYTGWHKANGLIIASATGSTAYALSVGGALMDPEGSRTLQLAPIAPLSLTSRPFVVSDRGSELIQVCVKVLASTDHPVCLKGDGLLVAKFTEDTCLTFGVSVTPVQIIQPAATSWYDTLAKKLNWNVGDVYRKGV